MFDDDFLSDQNLRDPHPLFLKMRKERPIHWSSRYRAWIVTRHSDVLRGLRDPGLSSDRIGSLLDSAPPESASRKALELLSDWMVFGIQN